MAESEATKREPAVNAIEGPAPSTAFQAELQTIGDTMTVEWQARPVMPATPASSNAVAAKLTAMERPANERAMGALCDRAQGGPR